MTPLAATSEDWEALGKWLANFDLDWDSLLRLAAAHIRRLAQRTDSQVVLETNPADLTNLVLSNVLLPRFISGRLQADTGDRIGFLGFYKLCCRSKLLDILGAKGNQPHATPEDVPLNFSYTHDPDLDDRREFLGKCCSKLRESGHEDYYDIFFHCGLREQKLNEYAAAKGITPESARQRWRRCQHLLRDLLGNDYAELFGGAGE